MSNHGLARDAHHADGAATQDRQAHGIAPGGDRDRLERLHHLVGVARPLLRILRHHPLDQRRQPRRQSGHAAAQGRGIDEQDLPQHLLLIRRLEGGAIGQRFVEHAAQREQVGARSHAQVVAQHLLGRDVAPGREARARAREASHRRLAATQAEVDQPGARGAEALQQDVARLHVPVEHADRVHRGERPRHGDPHRDDLGHTEVLPPQPLGQVLALEPLHDQVGSAAARGPGRQVPHDAGMGDAAEELGLADEACGAGAGRPQHLERDAIAAHLIVGDVQLALAAAVAQLADDEAVVQDVVEDPFGEHALSVPR